MFKRIANVSKRHILMGVASMGLNKGVLPFRGRICSRSTVRKVCMPNGIGTRATRRTKTTKVDNTGAGVSKKFSVKDRLITNTTGDIVGTAGSTTDGGVQGMGIAVGAGCHVLLERPGR